MPFYVSAEQQLKDKSDYARKGIARGRSVLVATYRDGVLFMGENPNRALHKISEIYDRIAFAAVGKYNEFENLRLAGVRYADLRGYQYDRSDVTGRGLANAYAQTLGTIFTEAGKPYEVEVVVAEVGRGAGDDQLYRLTYDGSITEEHDHVVMGGQAEPVAAVLREGHDPGSSLQDALRLGVRALAAVGVEGTGEDRTIGAAGLEAAVLDRTRTRRAFRRLPLSQLTRMLEESEVPNAGAGTGEDLPAGTAGSTSPAPEEGR